jgi:hypothetical protein
VDDLTRDLRLIDVIIASDAISNAQVVLEEALEDKDAEWCEGIRRNVFPVLEAEQTRLDKEYRRPCGWAPPQPPQLSYMGAHTICGRVLPILFCAAFALLKGEKTCSAR